MKVRLIAFVIWAAVAATAMFWILRLGVSSPSAPAHTVAVGPAAAPRGDLTRVFGAAPVAVAAGPNAVAQTPLSSRFKLLGLAAPRQGGDRNGLALIAVDGKPARAYAVGVAVDGDLLLQSVDPRSARLGVRGAPAQVTLELPALPLPATGSFPLAQASNGGQTGLATLPPTGGVGVPTIAPSQAPQGDAPPVPVPPPASNTR